MKKKTSQTYVMNNQNPNFKYDENNYRIIKHLHPFRSWETVYAVERRHKGILFKDKWKCLFRTGVKYYFESIEEAEDKLKEYLEVIATYDYIGKE